jgi:hypothetical protein
MKKIILLAAFQFILLIAFGQNFNVGDKVEIYNSGGWYKGSVLEIGSGNMQGYYSVSYDGYKQAQWMKAANIRLQKITATKPSGNTIAAGMALKAGDKVEIYNSGSWYKGSIVAIGANDMEGYYSVSYDGYKQLQWMKTTNIRLQKADAARPSSGPRSGTYLILSYGNPKNPLRLGYFKLNNGEYTYYDMGKKLIGQGSYTYDTNAAVVQWSNGPFKNSAWTGAFEIDREGKTHTIRLNTVTVGTNSTDSNLGF